MCIRDRFSPQPVLEQGDRPIAAYRVSQEKIRRVMVEPACRHPPSIVGREKGHREEAGRDALGP
eukprot:6281466-Alexandrium_andersonii.AAC.1